MLGVWLRYVGEVPHGILAPLCWEILTWYSVPSHERLPTWYSDYSHERAPRSKGGKLTPPTQPQHVPCAAQTRDHARNEQIRSKAFMKLEISHNGGSRRENKSKSSGAMVVQRQKSIHNGSAWQSDKNPSTVRQKWKWSMIIGIDSGGPEWPFDALLVLFRAIFDDLYQNTL